MQSGHHAAKTIISACTVTATTRRFATATWARWRQSPASGRSCTSAASRVAGFAGWLLWLVVHLAFLTGFKNRLGAVANWVVAFVGRGRRQRTITDQEIFARARALTQPEIAPPAK